MNIVNSNIIHNSSTSSLYQNYEGPGIHLGETFTNNNVFANTHGTTGVNNFNSNSQVPRVVDNAQYWGSNREDKGFGI